MIEQLITFETAKLAKEKNFRIITSKKYRATNYLCTNDGLNISLQDSLPNEDCNHPSTGYYSVPTQSLLQRWLREVHDIQIIVFSPLADKKYKFEVQQKCENNFYGYQNVEKYNFKTYEEALEEGLQEALKLI